MNTIYFREIIELFLLIKRSHPNKKSEKTKIMGKKERKKNNFSLLLTYRKVFINPL